MGVSSFVSLSLLVLVAATKADFNGTGYRLMKKIYEQCDQAEDVVMCLKIQALKIVDRALHSNSFKLFDGIYVVRDETARSLTQNLPPISDEKLQAMESNQIDGMLAETTDKFLESHKVKLDIPKLVEEGRGKIKRIMGPLMAAVAIKGGMMAMAMKGVAAMAGMALMLSKMALMLSSIMGLKKLLGGNGKEKTTVEIVKHPQFSYGSTYSSSYEDAGHYGNSGGGGGGGHGGGHGGYHRSFDASNDIDVQQLAYNSQIPKMNR